MDESILNNLDKKKNEFNELYKKALKEYLLNNDYSERISEILKYCLENEGKLIRPLLFFIICNDLNLQSNNFIKIALALELIHVSSLVHDDLPIMDNDDYRRGKLSCHKMFNSKSALLIGNILAIDSIKLITELNIQPEKQNKIIKIITTNFNKLNIGQFEEDHIGNNQNDILKVNALKTGSLFQSCFEISGVLSELPIVLSDKLSSIGLSFGICYQLKDDIEDSQNYLENHNWVGNEYVVQKEKIKDNITRLHEYIGKHNSMINILINLYI